MVPALDGKERGLGMAKSRMIFTGECAYMAGLDESYKYIYISLNLLWW